MVIISKPTPSSRRCKLVIAKVDGKERLSNLCINEVSRRKELVPTWNYVIIYYKGKFEELVKAAIYSYILKFGFNYSKVHFFVGDGYSNVHNVRLVFRPLFREYYDSNNKQLVRKLLEKDPLSRSDKMRINKIFEEAVTYLQSLEINEVFIFYNTHSIIFYNNTIYAKLYKNDFRELSVSREKIKE